MLRISKLSTTGLIGGLLASVHGSALGGLVASQEGPIEIDALTPTMLIEVTPSVVEEFEEIRTLQAARGDVMLSPPHIAVMDDADAPAGASQQAQTSLLGGPAESIVYVMPPDTIAFDFLVNPWVAESTLITVTAQSTYGATLMLVSEDGLHPASTGGDSEYFGFVATDGDSIASITVEVMTDVDAVVISDPRIAQTEQKIPNIADLNHDGWVGPADLAILLYSWGPCDANCDADLTGDGEVDTFDLAVLLGTWGNA